MKRILLVALLLALAAALPALSAETAAAIPTVSPAPAPALAMAAPFWASSSSQEIHLAVACLFPRCPIYPDIGCSCEWVDCNGTLVCGKPWSSAASRPSLRL